MHTIICLGFLVVQHRLQKVLCDHTGIGVIYRNIISVRPRVPVEKDVIILPWLKLEFSYNYQFGTTIGNFHYTITFHSHVCCVSCSVCRCSQGLQILAKINVHASIFCVSIVVPQIQYKWYSSLMLILLSSSQDPLV